MKIKLINYLDKEFSAELKKLIERNSAIDESLSLKVTEIINKVKEEGDKALIAICNKFDKASFSKASDLLVSESEIKQAKNNLNPELLAALKLAYERIYAYHS